MAPTKRQQQKAATRTLLLNTAYRLYAEQGFAIPTSAIAAAAGVSHGTLFAHFPTLDELLDCLLERFGSDLSHQLRRACAETRSLTGVLDAHLAALDAHEDFYVRLLQHTALLPPSARYTLVSIQAVLSHHMGLALEALWQSGQAKELPLHLLFNTWMGLVHHYLSNRDLFTPGEPLLPLRGQELRDTFIQLVQINP